MKINAIASVLKSGASIKLYRYYDEQYITNGFALYAVSNLPHIETNDQLCAVLGIPSDKQGKYNINIEAGSLLPCLCRTETDRALYIDTPIERDDLLSLNWLGEEYIIFKTDHKLLFVRRTYLKPFNEYEDLYYFDRHDTQDGKHVIVIKAGMLLVGIINPANIINDNFCKKLGGVIRLAQKEIDNEKYKDRLEYIDEQQVFDFLETDKE